MASMRTLPLVIALLAAVAAIWIVALRESPAPVGPDLTGPALPTADRDAAGGVLVGHGPTGGGPDGPAPSPRAGGPAPVDLRTVPRGDLEVLLVDEDGQRVPTDGVKLELERIGLPYPGYPLALRDIEARSWTYRGVPVGRVRVKATGWHFHDAEGEAEIRAEAGEPLTISVRRAGSIQVQVQRTDGTAPTGVRATLADEAGRPVKAWWQERSSHRIGPRVRGASAEVGSEGWISALPAGRYRLDIESDAGFRDKAWVEVAPGTTVTQRFTLPQ